MQASRLSFHNLNKSSNHEAVLKVFSGSVAQEYMDYKHEPLSLKVNEIEGEDFR